MCPQLWAGCVVESPSVRLPRKYFAGWRHTFKVMVALLGWWCGWPFRGCALTWCWLGGHTGLRDKRICVGALLGVWGSTRLFLLGPCVNRPRWLWLVVCGGCVV